MNREDAMNDDTESKKLAPEGEARHAAKNDGPDETPVYEDLYHDEGRRNVLEEEGVDRAKEREGDGTEKGDDL
jgi:hypothetical protein